MCNRHFGDAQCDRIDFSTNAQCDTKDLSTIAQGDKLLVILNASEESNVQNTLRQT